MSLATYFEFFSLSTLCSRLNGNTIKSYYNFDDYVYLVSSSGFFLKSILWYYKIEKNSNKVAKLIEFSLVNTKYHNFPHFFLLKIKRIVWKENTDSSLFLHNSSW